MSERRDKAEGTIERLASRNGEAYWGTWILLGILIITVAFLVCLFVSIWPNMGPAYNGFDRAAPGGN